MQGGQSDEDQHLQGAASCAGCPGVGAGRQTIIAKISGISTATTRDGGCPIDDLRYPIGRFAFDPEAAPRQRAARINELAQLPAMLREAVAGLNDEQLDTPYREGGWTVRQVVHHVADSHMNFYVYARLALTEDRPLVKTYDQKAWAELPDARTAPVEPSLALIEVLHERFVALLRSLTPDDFTRTFQHSKLGEMSLDRLVALYAWHGKHHTAHIRSLRERMGW